MARAFGKRNLIVGLILLGLGVLGAASQTWVTFALPPQVASKDSFSVAGSGAYVSLVPMALSVAIGAIVLTIVPKFLRIALSVVLVLLGGGIFAVTFWFLQAPIFAGAKDLMRLTGINNQDQVFVLQIQSVSAWPVVTLILALLMVVFALVSVFVSPGWADGGKKYDAVRAKRQDVNTPNDDRVSAWDQLTHGEDPSV